MYWCIEKHSIALKNNFYIGEKTLAKYITNLI
jgi:hypothetical protein